jgi:puromycin-sensitive aminopeptidase
MSSEKSNCLLPESVVPANYKLHLSPNLENFTFAGVVSIEVDIRQPVREITLHAAELEIKASNVDVSLNAKPSSVISPLEVRFDQEAETATFVFAEELPVGGASLEIEYTGILNDKMNGFYRSKYTTASGETKYMATTQFEATDARRALPCWDEPACKATFDVRLIVPKHLTALSNMPIESTKLLVSNDRKLVKFGRTPVMSTYLLAFVVGEFEFIETQTNNGTLVRVYTLPGKTEQGQFALDVGRRSLELYNSYFDIPYPLPKLDMIAIPDFSAGAMENWGLVTYRENALLIDKANSSITSKQRVAEVVAHELAHQWFGNLVTMQWWTNLWLNEGFATWMANFVMDKLFPEWDMWTQFLGDDIAQALALDGLRSTHAIEVPVSHPNEISQIFDAISYSKGASVIHMIHEFIGAKAFRNGMQIYLKRHASGNAVTEDLWTALAEASGQPVAKMMDTWTKQAGYPLIQVVRQNDNMCTLSQKRFLAGGDTLTETESAQQWHIPLASEFRRQNGQSDYFKNIFSDAKTADQMSVQGTNFVKLNSGQIAFARVNYLPEQWQDLTEAIAEEKLSPADRYSIISDALSLARAGQMSTGQLIRLLSSYKNENNYTVWMAVLGALSALDNILEETPHSTRFATFARSALAPIASKLGWSQSADEHHTITLLRESVLHAMGSYGDYNTIAKAKTHFHEHASDIRSADPNLRKAIYGITAQYGDNKTFNTMLEMYRKETFQEEKIRLLMALGKFSDPVSVPTALEYTFSSGEVRPGDLFYMFSSLGSHAHGRRAVWKFITANWKSMSERYASGGMKMLGHIIAGACNSFARAEDAAVIEQFFKDNPAPSATRSIAETIERISVKATWYERDKDDIASALKG